MYLQYAEVEVAGRVDASNTWMHLVKQIKSPNVMLGTICAVLF
jgi:hypothetical protein